MIHKTAIIDPKAKINSDVKIGPYCVIGPNVEIGENTVVILSTHIVDDVKELCTKMAIINQGEVLLTGNPIETIKSIEGKVWSKTIEKEELETYKKDHTVISVQSSFTSSTI